MVTEQEITKKLPTSYRGKDGIWRNPMFVTPNVITLKYSQIVNHK